MRLAVSKRAAVIAAPGQPPYGSCTETGQRQRAARPFARERGEYRRYDRTEQGSYRTRRKQRIQVSSIASPDELYTKCTAPYINQSMHTPPYGFVHCIVPRARRARRRITRRTVTQSAQALASVVVANRLAHACRVVYAMFCHRCDCGSCASPARPPSGASSPLPLLWARNVAGLVSRGATHPQRPGKALDHTRRVEALHP